jgi:hypothetical protein
VFETLALQAMDGRSGSEGRSVVRRGEVMTTTTMDGASVRASSTYAIPGDGAGTRSDRRTAKIVGILFIVATVASLLGSAALGTTLDGRNYLAALATHETQVIIAALFFLIAATSAFATAFLLFPILRRYSEGLAAGYVGLRAFENVFYAASVVLLLTMLSVSQSDAVGAAGASSVPLLGAALLSAREWFSSLGTLIFFGVGAVILNDVLFRSRLVPRWLSAWGLIGGALVLLYGLLGILGFDTELGSPFMLLAMPTAVQEMVFAGWLLTKGFAPSPTTADA